MRNLRVYFRKTSRLSAEERTIVREDIEACVRFVRKSGYRPRVLVFVVGGSRGRFLGMSYGYANWHLPYVARTPWVWGSLIELYSRLLKWGREQFLRTTFHEIAHALRVEGGGYRLGTRRSDEKRENCEADASTWAEAMLADFLVQ